MARPERVGGFTPSAQPDSSLYTTQPTGFFVLATFITRSERVGAARSSTALYLCRHDSVAFPVIDYGLSGFSLLPIFTPGRFKSSSSCEFVFFLRG